MRVRFVGQPFKANPNLYDVLTGALARSDVDELTIVTAWGKRSGLSRVQSELALFRERGGTSRIVLGIDEGGATEQGLRLALELFSSAHVFHDPSRRTFHPKLYIAKGADSAVVMVGSNNLTAGGIYYNYEAANHLELDLLADSDSDYLSQVDAFVDALLSEEELCLPLDEELFEYLIRNRDRFRIGDEDVGRSRSPRRGEPEDTDQGIGDGQQPEDSPFGRPAGGRRSDPRPRSGPVAAPTSGRATVTGPTAGDSGESASVGVASGRGEAVQRRWFKQLPLADAQQNEGNKTANLRLTQARLGIDWLTFFRDDLFGGEEWGDEVDPNGHAKEVTDIAFEVVFEGRPMGTHMLRVAHAPHRESDQRNHATVLHWGDLNAHLRRNDYSKAWVVLERRSDGSYRLEIQRAKPTEPPIVG